MFRRLFAFVALFALLIAPFDTAVAKGRAEIPEKVGKPYMGAITIDAATGKVLFEDHADTAGYPASVQKTMTLLVILERVKQGAVRLDEPVQVTVEASKMGGSQVYLDPKESFPVEDLLYALMVQSANDAALLLAQHVGGSKEGFVDLMNQKAKAIGMKNTTFHSPHGLPPSAGQEPDVTTARDLAILGRELITKHPEALKYTGTINHPFRDGQLMMENHDHLLKSFPGCDGLKTGYYTKAGYSIISTASRNGARVITVVLGAEKGKNPRHPNNARDEMAAQLMSKGLATLTSAATK